MLVIGSVLYAAGLVTMGLATSGASFLGGTGLLIGMAQAGTTYAVIYGIIGRIRLVAVEGGPFQLRRRAYSAGKIAGVVEPADLEVICDEFIFRDDSGASDAWYREP